MPLALYWLLDQAANSLHRDALRSQAFTIGSFLRPQPDGGVALDIPADVRPLYSGGYGLYAYAVLDAEGRVLFSSRPDGAALFAPTSSAVRDWFGRRRSTGDDAVRRQRGPPDRRSHLLGPGRPGPRPSRRDHRRRRRVVLAAGRLDHLSRSCCCCC